MELDDIWTSECCFSSDIKTAKAKLPIWVILRELAMLYSKEGGKKYIVKVRECQLPHDHPHHHLLGVHMLTQARADLHMCFTQCM